MFKSLFRKLAERINYDYEKPCILYVPLTHTLPHTKALSERYCLGGGVLPYNFKIYLRMVWFSGSFVWDRVHFLEKWPALK